MVRILQGLAIVAAGLAVTAQAPVAASLEWSLENLTDADISLEFRSQDRTQVWPGGDEVYLLAPGDGERTYGLDCDQGETICYGGWTGEDEPIQWGRGYNDGQACTDCCAICAGGSIGLIELTR